MSKRCKHVEKDGFNCGSYAFNLYKDDIYQDDLCDVHYWQNKAQRTWVGLTDEQREDIQNNFEILISKHFFDAVEVRLKELNHD
jgi:hypothetical protein